MFDLPYVIIIHQVYQYGNKYFNYFSFIGRRSISFIIFVPEPLPPSFIYGLYSSCSVSYSSRVIEPRSIYCIPKNTSSTWPMPTSNSRSALFLSNLLLINAHKPDEAKMDVNMVIILTLICSRKLTEEKAKQC